jgi:hypothetical protein
MADESLPAQTVAGEGTKNFNNRISEFPSEYDTHGDENASKEVEELPYDPTNVFSMLGYAFKQHLESKSWAERKRALDQLLDSLEVCGDLDKQLQYTDLLSSLKNVSLLIIILYFIHLIF